MLRWLTLRQDFKLPTPLVMLPPGCWIDFQPKFGWIETNPPIGTSCAGGCLCTMIGFGIFYFWKFDQCMPWLWLSCTLLCSPCWWPGIWWRFCEALAEVCQFDETLAWCILKLPKLFNKLPTSGQPPFNMVEAADHLVNLAHGTVDRGEPLSVDRTLTTPSKQKKF